MAQIRLIGTHGALLLEIASDPDVTVDALARRLRASTRSVRRWITDLEEAGALARVLQGNRQRYELQTAFRPDGAPPELSIAEFLQRFSE